MLREFRGSPAGTRGGEEQGFGVSSGNLGLDPITNDNRLCICNYSKTETSGTWKLDISIPQWYIIGMEL